MYNWHISNISKMSHRKKFNNHWNKHTTLKYFSRTAPICLKEFQLSSFLWSLLQYSEIIFTVYWWETKKDTVTIAFQYNTGWEAGKGSWSRVAYNIICVLLVGWLYSTKTVPLTVAVIAVLLKEEELPRISREMILHGSVTIEISIMSYSSWSRSFSATYNGLSDVRQHVNG